MINKYGEYQLGSISKGDTVNYIEGIMHKGMFYFLANGNVLDSVVSD